MTGENAKSVSRLSLHRLEGLSDGVFAVAITLLVLNITAPALLSPTASIFGGSLFDLWPKVLVYGASFFLIGIFWFGHYLMFHYIEWADRTLMWLNNLLLMLVCFIPFSANVIGSYPFLYPSYLLYGSTLSLASLFYFLLWRYAVGRKLTKQNIDTSFVKKASMVVGAAPVFYIIATLFVFVNMWLALALFVLVPVLYVIPSPVDDLFPKE